MKDIMGNTMPLRQQFDIAAKWEREMCARLVEQAKVAVSNETNPATVCDRLAKMIRERK